MEQTVQKNQLVKVKIDGLNEKGEGVGSINGYPLYVVGGLPGDEGEVRIISVKKEYARGQLVTIKRQSDHRVKEKCSLFGRCGGCDLQHLDYQAQLRWKTEFVQTEFKKYKSLNGVSIHPLLGMDNPWEYRHKIQYVLGMKGNKIIGGFYAKRSHELVPVDSCLIQTSAAQTIKTELLSLLTEAGFTVYDEKSGRGQMKYLLIRIAQRTGEIMMVLVTKEGELPCLKKIGNKIREKFPSVTSIQHNVNSLKGNVILGKENFLLAGSPTITEYIGDLVFKLSPRSFFQVNPVQTEVIYGKALEYAALTGEETVLDAYCGLGTISLFLARKAKKVIGIELIEEAVDAARENARLNGVDNADFFVGDVIELAPRLYEKGVRPEVVVVDPPRKGCSREVLDVFTRMKPQRIVYVSCNPVTLARDLDYLSRLGYRTVEAQPVDMFPQTTHVECVIGMQRKDT